MHATQSCSQKILFRSLNTERPSDRHARVAFASSTARLFQLADPLTRANRAAMHNDDPLERPSPSSNGRHGPEPDSDDHSDDDDVRDRKRKRPISVS